MRWTTLEPGSGTFELRRRRHAGQGARPADRTGHAPRRAAAAAAVAAGVVVLETSAPRAGAEEQAQASGVATG